MQHRGINLHHASLLVGGTEDAEVYFKELCLELGIVLANNPDYFPFRKETFGIEEAREVKTLATRGAVGRAKIFFIAPAYFTLEAQNALLKTFEDPFPNTYFFIVSRDKTALIQTLLSRVEAREVPKVSKQELSQAEKFLALPIKDRLLFVKKFVDDELNLSEFLDKLLILVRKSGKREMVKKIFDLRKFSRYSTPAPRLVLEHLALVL